MSDNKAGNGNNNEAPKKTLTLKSGAGGGTVRQNFSHGRSNKVVVETKKRRITKPGDAKKPATPISLDPKPAAQAAPEPKAPSPQEQAHKSIILKELSEGEVEARAKALQEAKKREEDDLKRAEEIARERAEQAEEEAKEAAERAKREAEEAKKREEDELKAKAKAEEDARLAAADASAVAAAADSEFEKPTKKSPPKEKIAAPAPLRTVKRPEETPKPTAKPKTGGDRRRTKLTLTNALDEREERGVSLSALRRRREKEKRAQQQSGPREKVMREVTIPETITIQELAQRMTERSVDVIKLLMQQGQMMKPGDIIEGDTAELIAVEMGHTVKRVSESDVEEGLHDAPDNPEDLESRPPIVTIMGHVDHGKTSLLDALRNTKVVDKEAGGITQHIGAYQVEHNGQKISFIDTPGHEAFTTMRARGAEVTDIAILVVAADDGVMPQTIESINHAKAAGVPIIVAINKIDKPNVDPARVRTELLQHEVFVESMGGDVLEVEVSAKEGTNLDKLLETLILQSEILELQANPNRPAEGIVVEAQLERGRGPVATVLVQRGTLNVGEIIIAGTEWGRVRALVNDEGKHEKSAVPAQPVEVLGLSGAPAAGDRIAVVENEARAREISEYRQRKAREMTVAKAAGSRGSLEQMMTQLQTTGAQEAPIVVKGDVQGSVEAIIGALDKLGTEEVMARVVHSAVGGITESDVSLAAASGAPIIGFNVRASRQARDMAEREGIEIRYYSIIYDLVDDIKGVMSGMLSPERKETFIGNAEILEVFNVSKVGKVAGCQITEGKVERGAGVRLIRDDVVIHEGELSTLKRFKDEVSEVPSGQECGMGFTNYHDLRKGDIIECFRVEHLERSL
jgi:translation initiation factor IF-2